MFSTLVSAQQLKNLQSKGQTLALFDCSFDLMRPALGAQHYLESHIPGARHADLDQHLSDKSGATDRASGGRHPLPARE